MSYEELDRWVKINAPNLNKEMLHTQVASIVSSETPVSDFSTATVTVNVADTIPQGANIPIATVVSEEDYVGMIYHHGLLSSVLTIPLYKGKAILYVGDTYTITTSGSVTYNEDNRHLVVTGDGTVNVEAER